MKQRVLGGTGMWVSEYALGTMMLGAMGNPDHDESVRMIHTALDAGINFVDTADVYSLGESEEIVGQALKGRRDEVVLATKFGLPVGPDPNQRGGSPRWIARAVEHSLRRLGTDHIDLYQMHRPDRDTDIDETLSALSDLVRAGKVRAIGSSTFPADLIVEAQWVAERRGHHRFRTEQPRYSIFSRTIEASVLPAAQRHGMGVLTYGPLSSGWLSGRADPTRGHRAEGFGARNFDLAVPGNRAKLEAVEPAHRGSPPRRGCPSPTWPPPSCGPTRRSRRSSSVPGHPAQLDDLLAGGDVELDGDILDRIDEIVAPGTELNPADNTFATPPAIEDKRLRRR